MKFIQRIHIVGMSLTALLLVCGTTIAFEDQSVPDAGAGVGPKIPAAFQNRDTGKKKEVVALGGSEESEHAVGAALNWLARHQNPDGDWGCKNFSRQCKDPSCEAHAGTNIAVDYSMAATAFGLLPFLSAGQTHESKGPYQATIRKGLIWMVQHQDQKTGQLGTGSMYEHGLATIALCDAYGLSQDKNLRAAAQAAVRFTEDAQNDSSGGWHYTANPPTVGDTSVFGWQFMSLMTAEMAGLDVDKATLVKAQKFLVSVSKGNSGGLSSYMPEGGPSPAMSAVGLLCNQYRGRKRTNPAMEEGVSYMMGNLNSAKADSYFLYYATQAMHNLPGPEWDKWNRETQRFLIDSQIKEGCAAGSWKPTGHTAGPVMATSIHALTLEVYYRYLPLFELEKNEKPKTE